jgi:hypothetical protein
LPLRDAIDGVDVVQPLGAVLIALVHAVDTDEAWPAIGRGRLAGADGDRLCGARLGRHHALRAVALAGAQVVQVRHRDRAQARKARIAEDIALPA